MAKYHINSKGVPAICRAEKGNCPFGGDVDHYDSPEEAQKAADEANKAQFGILGNSQEQSKPKKTFTGIRSVAQANGKPQGFKFTSYGKLNKHRAAYYRNNSGLSTSEFIELYSKELSKDETGREALLKTTQVLARNHKLKRAKSNDEWVDFSLIRKEIGNEEEVAKNLEKWSHNHILGPNKYFDKIDATMNIDSKQGFIRGKNHEESKSIYLDEDKHTFSKEDVEKVNETLSARKNFYNKKIDDEKTYGKVKDLLDQTGNSKAKMVEVENAMFGEKTGKELKQLKEDYKNGDKKELWANLKARGVEKHGGEKNFYKQLITDLGKGNTEEHLTDLDAKLNWSSRK